MYKEYNLEERTYQFAKKVRTFVKRIPKTLANIEDAKQVIRSSGSVAANYIESVEALSEKDRVYRLRICRKESKESKLWLKLINIDYSRDLDEEKRSLVQESYELTCIFGSIISKKESAGK